MKKIQASYIEKPKETLSFDEWLDKELPAQFEEKIKILNRVGLLDILSNGEMGIVGIDGKEYPLPLLKDVRKEIEENREILETKYSQGFDELGITPFALPLNRFIEVLRKRLLIHNKNNQLSISKEILSEKYSESILRLDTDSPVSVGRGVESADTEEKLVYYPKNLNDAFHGGLTKKEILRNSRYKQFKGFNIFLKESSPLPYHKQGKIKNGRKQLESGGGGEGYLWVLQTKDEYKHEKGQTPEDWLAQTIIDLEKNHKISNSEAVCFPGSYFLGMKKEAPFALWEVSHNDYDEWGAPIDSPEKIIFLAIREGNTFGIDTPLGIRPIIEISKPDENLNSL